MTSSLNELEKAVLRDFLSKNNVSPSFFGEDFQYIQVGERHIEGTGYSVDVLTEKSLSGTEVEKAVWLNKTGRRWLDTNGKINSDIDVGFTVYIDDYSKISFFEGYTIGIPWPEKITDFKIN